MSICLLLTEKFSLEALFYKNFIIIYIENFASLATMYSLALQKTKNNTYLVNIKGIIFSLQHQIEEVDIGKAPATCAI